MVSKKMVYSNALLIVCISAVLVPGFSFLMTNTDYCILLVWRVISSHTGTERMFKFAIGHNLCGVFKCNFLSKATTQPAFINANSLMSAWCVSG